MTLKYSLTEKHILELIMQISYRSIFEFLQVAHYLR